MKTYDIQTWYEDKMIDSRTLDTDPDIDEAIQIGLAVKEAYADVSDLDPRTVEIRVQMI